MTCDGCNQPINDGEEYVATRRYSTGAGESLTTYTHLCCDTEFEEYVNDRGDTHAVAWVCRTHPPPLLTLDQTPSSSPAM
jgi:hypothetical protein